MILGDIPLGDAPLGSVALFGVAGRDAVLSADVRAAPRYATAVKQQPVLAAEIKTEPES